jgi:hypothetical protein
MPRWPPRHRSARSWRRVASSMGRLRQLRHPAGGMPVRRRRRADHSRRTACALRRERQRRRSEGAAHRDKHRNRRDAANGPLQRGPTRPEDRNRRRACQGDRRGRYVGPGQPVAIPAATSTPGTKIAHLTGADNAGNTTTRNCRYLVLGQINPSLIWGFRPEGPSTQVASLVAGHLPRRTTIKVLCRGAGCRSASRTVHLGEAKRGARRRPHGAVPRLESPRGDGAGSGDQPARRNRPRLRLHHAKRSCAQRGGRLPGAPIARPQSGLLASPGAPRSCSALRTCSALRIPPSG